MIRKITIISIVVFFLLFLLTFIFLKPYYTFATKTLHISPVQTILGKGTIKQSNNKVNILVLGIAGGSHDGPLLSDSIIVAQYDFKKNSLTTIGLPRDIWSDTLRDKLNSAYVYGEEKQKGSGLKLAKAEVGAIIGQPVQYGVVISFDKFTELIDMLDGIDVMVEHSFTDPMFPVSGKENDDCAGDFELNCRYESISFKKGLHHLDGKTALKFVRSRYSEGDEGTDFARSKRQQLVIDGIKDKLLAVVKADLQSYSLKRTEEFYTELDSLVERDITNNELAFLGRIIFSKGTLAQSQKHLESAWFEVPDYEAYEGKYVLIPVNNDYETLHKNINCLFDSSCS